MYLQFLRYVTAIGCDSVDREAHFVGYLLVLESAGHMADHLLLAFADLA